MSFERGSRGIPPVMRKGARSAKSGTVAGNPWLQQARSALSNGKGANLPGVDTGCRDLTFQAQIEKNGDAQWAAFFVIAEPAAPVAVGGFTNDTLRHWRRNDDYSN
jgi:hypothetical protein